MGRGEWIDTHSLCLCGSEDTVLKFTLKDMVVVQTLPSLSALGYLLWPREARTWPIRTDHGWGVKLMIVSGTY